MALESNGTSRVRSELPRPKVEGYKYLNEFDEDRDLEVCTIVGRADHDQSMTGFSPTFVIRFGDGVEAVAISEQLHPWYPEPSRN